MELIILTLVAFMVYFWNRAQYYYNAFHAAKNRLHELGEKAPGYGVPKMDNPPPPPKRTYIRHADHVEVLDTPLSRARMEIFVNQYRAYHKVG